MESVLTGKIADIPENTKKPGRESPLGLYLHIPFCTLRCAYCDFYSAVTTEVMLDRYAVRLSEEIRKWGKEIRRPLATVYFGGGTPSLLGERISGVMSAVRESFEVMPDVEITLEANPECFILPAESADGKQMSLPAFLSAAVKSGVNRLSIGVQSGLKHELKLLGRRHTAADAENAVKLARQAGFKNISLDLMIGLPDSDCETLRRSLDFLLGLEPEHISAYMLKLEPNTALERRGIALPDDDSVAEQYLFTCEYLEKAGFRHYEISNFARSGFEGRHNSGYWNGGEYLGIGPSAHSYLVSQRKGICETDAAQEERPLKKQHSLQDTNALHQEPHLKKRHGLQDTNALQQEPHLKKRFFYPRDLKAFLNGSRGAKTSAEEFPDFPQSISPLIISDGYGGSSEEYIMLALRTSDGINFREYERLFEPLPHEFHEECRRLEKAGLMRVSEASAALTDRGMLVSNSIILRLIEFSAGDSR